MALNFLNVEIIDIIANLNVNDKDLEEYWIE
jgi:hypothetical protein